MAAPRKYSLEVRERAVRMYRSADPKPQIKKLAVDLGCASATASTLARTSEFLTRGGCAPHRARSGARLQHGSRFSSVTVGG